MNGWCGHNSAVTSWADVDGDGKADIICDDQRGNHWIRTMNSGKIKKDYGHVQGGWCAHGGAYTQWADIDGDGKADMICDDSKGNHWIKLSKFGTGHKFKDLGHV